jgi:polar amino acid transport system substrate-binding protein
MAHAARALAPIRPLRRLVCVALALAIASCATPSRTTRGLARISESGELRVGMTGEQPPLNMTARSGELIGLEVALVRVLARSIGVEARLVRLPFRELLPALERGEIDIAMSGLTINPERSARVTLVGAYYISGKALLTRSESLAGAEVPEDLDQPGLRVAALAGSTSEAFARGSLPRAKLVRVERLEAGIERVRKGEVDALVADRETCHFAVLRYPDAGLLVSAASFTVEPMGIAVPQDQPALANLLQTYLTALADEGVLEKARAYWFQDPAWVKDLR